jgi:hypothetical protein
MFKRKKMSDNPEVKAAMKERDDLLGEVEKAVAKVDRVVDELLDEYEQANGVQKEGD